MRLLLPTIESMLALAALEKSPIIAPEVDIVEVTSITELTSIGDIFKELGVLLVREDGAKAPARGPSSATTVQIRKKIFMIRLDIQVHNGYYLC
jgi:hypothetical protein